MKDIQRVRTDTRQRSNTANLCVSGVAGCGAAVSLVGAPEVLRLRRESRGRLQEQSSPEWLRSPVPLAVQQQPNFRALVGQPFEEAEEAPAGENSQTGPCHGKRPNCWRTRRAATSGRCPSVRIISSHIEGVVSTRVFRFPTFCFSDISTISVTLTMCGSTS